MPALWLNLARSGGTMIARCLGCMQGVVLLSEVHPLGVRVIDPARQAARWHALLSPAELEAVGAGRERFDRLIALLDQRCRERGRTLVLRDWSHLDFLGVPFTEPSFSSRSRALLGAEAPAFATVRHPADQWASQQRLDILRGRVDPEIYLRGCEAFARAAAEVGFVRYEDFTEDPDRALRALCEGLGAPFDPTWTERYRHYAKVSGDEEASRGAVGEIRPARRRHPEAEVLERFRASGAYRRACELLGYEP
jgi:protein O-GlcNAc transferase